MLAYGILSMGMLRLYQRLRVLRPEVPGDFASGAISDAERLSTAMRFLVDGGPGAIHSGVRSPGNVRR